MSDTSEFRERLKKINPSKRASEGGPAQFTVWLMKREVSKLTDEELEVLIAQFKVEVSE